MTRIDALILLVFVAYAIGAGLRARRRASRSLEEYFLAGRGLSGWQAGISMAATQFAADTPLVVTGLIASAGVFALWQLWSYGLAFLLLGFLFAPCWRRARVLTDAEFSELRYSGHSAAILRGVRALLFGVAFNCVVVAMVLFAATLLAESFLAWDQWLPGALYEPLHSAFLEAGWSLTAAPGTPQELATRSGNNLISILAILAVTSLYSTTGGLRSVVATDLVQFALMMGATALYTALALAQVGSLPELNAALVSLADQDRLGGLRPGELFALFPASARDATPGLVAVFALQWLLQRNADGTGYLAQRSMACASDADARRASVLFAFLQVVLRSFLWVPLGLALLVLFPPSGALTGDAFIRERESTFILGMRQVLPPGILGLMLTGMLAALASTLDTHLNWGSSYLANDLYARLYARGLRGREPGQRELVWVARLSNVVIVAVSLALMTQLGSIQSVWKLTLVLGSGIGIVTVLRWLWWRVTAYGELAALAVCFAGTPFVIAFVPTEAFQMLGMAAAATAAAVVVSLLGPATERSILEDFVRRVRPPGWWGPFDSGAGRQQLGRALLAALAAAVSLFGSLLCGLWLLLSHQPGWVAGLLGAIALLATPLWVPALAKDLD